MGLRGPVPKPSYLKLLEGNPGRRPIGKGEPMPDKCKEPPKAPLYFDAKRIELWKVVCRELIKVDCLTSADYWPLERYVEFMVQWREARDFVVKHGTVLPMYDENGKIKYLAQVPQVSQMRNISMHLLRLEQQFGLTPSARTRIMLGQPSGEPEDDPFE